MSETMLLGYFIVKYMGRLLRMRLYTLLPGASRVT